MKVALLLRPDADARPGGDVVQARAIAQYLRGRGVEVLELRGWAPDLTGCSAAVVMNLTVPEQAWLHTRACQRAAVPYLLLPVFWDLAEAIPGEQRPSGSALLPPGSWRRGAAQRLRLAMKEPSSVARVAGSGFPDYVRARDNELVAQVVGGADAVCPNSMAELDHLARFTGLVPTPRWVVVRNGLWSDELPPLSELSDAHRDDVVVSVGAVSPRKNTLGLMRAARQLDCPVIVVGQQARAGDAYAARVRTEAPDNVEFAGLMPRPDVLRLLARARVHVQPGFVETPGLASLEAAALLTAVVVSDTAPVREYFGSAARYAEPHRPETIAEAIEDAWIGGPDQELARTVRERYDWREALRPLATLLGL